MTTDANRMNITVEVSCITLLKHNKRWKSINILISYIRNVSKYSYSVGSIYVNVSIYKGSSSHIIKFDVNILFDDIIEIIAFGLFNK